MNKILNLGFVFFVVATCLLLVFSPIVREARARSTFARQVCDNLIQSGYMSEPECIISDSVGEVFIKTFPEGTELDYVLAGMDGFKKSSDTTRIIPECKSYRLITYTIIPGALFAWDESIVYTFCDDILFNIEWRN
jgi:hypothetical protein